MHRIGKMHRIGWIGVAVLVALGLLWSVAATPNWSPAQRGNQLARDAVRQSGSANMNAPADPAFMPPQCWLSRPGTAPRLGFLCRPSALVGQAGLIA